MLAHGWSPKALALMFRVSVWSVSRAIENTKYNPRDRIDEDYDRAGTDFLSNDLPRPRDSLPKHVQPTEIIYIGRDDECDDDEVESDHQAEYSSNGRPQRTAKMKCKTRMREVAEDEDDEPLPAPTPHKRTYEDASAPFSPIPSGSMGSDSAGSSVKRQRYSDELPATQSQGQGSTPSGSTSAARATHTSPSSSVPFNKRPILAQEPVRPQAAVNSMFSPVMLNMLKTPLSLPHTSSNTHVSRLEQSNTAELSAFLKNFADVDFSSHHELLKTQGFTVPRLHAIATWGKDEIHEGLQRLLMGSGAAAAGRPGMTALLLIRFEIAIGKLKATSRGPAPLPRSLLPPPSSNATNSGTTLPVFLKNVMGFDLSEYHALLVGQGFDIAALSVMPAWDRGQLQEVLACTLLEPKTEADRKMSLVPREKKGMKALEVLALEFCIRRAGTEI